MNLIKIINVPFIRNMTWLTVLQLANILIPLIVLPYIVRIFGADLFGKVSYAQNIISYLTLLINFGFDYSATREIAINKNNIELRNKIFWTVIKAKSLLLVLSLLLLVILYFCFDRVAENIVLYLCVFITNVGVVVFPGWFLQGTSKMKKLAIFNVLFKSSGLLFTFFFVHQKADYLYYPLLISLGAIVIGFISFFYIIKRYNISFLDFKSKYKFEVIKAGGSVFLNMLFATIYSSASLTILGFYFSDNDIGLYSGVQKIIFAIMLLTSTPLHAAVFPEISYRFSESLAKGKLFFNRILKYVALYGLVISIITYFLSDKLVLWLLGSDFLSSIPLMKTFSLLPFLVMLASLFTIQGLYGAGLQRYAPFIGAIVSIISIVANILFLQKYGMQVSIIVWVLSECIEILLAGFLFYYGLKKVKIKGM